MLYDWRQAVYGVLLVSAGIPAYFAVRRFLPAANRDES